MSAPTDAEWNDLAVDFDILQVQIKALDQLSALTARTAAVTSSAKRMRPLPLIVCMGNGSTCPPRPR